MPVRTLHTFLLIVALASVACGSDAEPTPDELTGVILSIDAEALGQVESFELKAGDETYDIYIESGVDFGFPLGHLHEHLQSSDPVRVELNEKDGKLFATEIEDA